MVLPKVLGAGAPSEFCPIMIPDIMVRCFHRIMAQKLSGPGTELPTRYGSCRWLSNTIRITSALSTSPLRM